jgi:hypothetical protein
MKSNRKFIKAEEGPKNSVIYYDADGNKLIRHWKNYEGQPADQASTRSWRNNNPGNMKYKDFARQHGAIGKAGDAGKGLKWAVFPDYATGRKAQKLRLKDSMYIDLTLHDLPRKYTGVEPGDPDTEEAINYRRSIRIITKFDLQRTVGSLTEAELEKLQDAMQTHEGWREGPEEFIEVKKIIGVHVLKNWSISEFLIEGSAGKEWISKNDAVILAEKGKLHAVLVHTKHGSYLRPEYHQTAFKNMVLVS